MRQTVARQNGSGWNDPFWLTTNLYGGTAADIAYHLGCPIASVKAARRRHRALLRQST